MKIVSWSEITAMLFLLILQNCYFNRQGKRQYASDLQVFQGLEEEF